MYLLQSNIKGEGAPRALTAKPCEEPRLDQCWNRVTLLFGTQTGNAGSCIKLHLCAAHSRSHVVDFVCIMLANLASFSSTWHCLFLFQMLFFRLLRCVIMVSLVRHEYFYCICTQWYSRQTSTDTVFAKVLPFVVLRLRLSRAKI
jgi:hypothetical protein